MKKTLFLAAFLSLISAASFAGQNGSQTTFVTQGTVTQGAVSKRVVTEVRQNNPKTDVNQGASAKNNAYVGHVTLLR